MSNTTLFPVKDQHRGHMATRDYAIQLRRLRSKINTTLVDDFQGLHHVRLLPLRVARSMANLQLPLIDTMVVTVSEDSRRQNFRSHLL